MTDRITSTYWMRRPRWRTGYERPVRWHLFRLWDFVPLVAAFVTAGFTVLPGWVVSLLTAWYFVAFPVVFMCRLRRRRVRCAAEGHVPYRPVPEVDEWECLRCGSSLSIGADPQLVATSVARAASEVRLEHRRQSYYSDRR